MHGDGIDALLADADKIVAWMREKHILKARVGGFEFVAAPSPPERPPAREPRRPMSDGELAAARTEEYRKLFGRTPTKEELERLP